jgi:transcriptional regulator with XRE-family HTH domain
MNPQTYRLQKKLSTKQMGQIIGRSARAILQYERGERAAGDDVLVRYFRHSHGTVTPNDFFYIRHAALFIKKSRRPRTAPKP